jgi:hypothetical protein
MADDFGVVVIECRLARFRLFFNRGKYLPVFFAGALLERAWCYVTRVATFLPFLCAVRLVGKENNRYKSSTWRR